MILIANPVHCLRHTLTLEHYDTFSFSRWKKNICKCWVPGMLTHTTTKNPLLFQLSSWSCLSRWHLWQSCVIRRVWTHSYDDYVICYTFFCARTSHLSPNPSSASALKWTFRVQMRFSNGMNSSSQQRLGSELSTVRWQSCSSRTLVRLVVFVHSGLC